MTVSITFNGTQYNCPTQGELDWSSAVTNLLVDLGGNAVTASSTATLLNKLVRAQDGTVSAPALSFTSDTNTGIYRVTTDTMGFATAGTLRVSINAAGFVTATGGISTQGAGSWSSHNVGKHLLLTGGSGNNPALGLADSENENLWAIWNAAGDINLAAMPALNDGSTGPDIVQTWTADGTSVTGTLSATGAVSALSTLGVTGNTQLGGNLAITGTTSGTGLATFAALTATAAVNCNSTLAVGGNATVTGSTTTGSFVSSGNAAVGGTLNITGAVATSGALTTAGGIVSNSSHITAAGGRIRASQGAYGTGDAFCGTLLGDFAASLSSITSSGYVRLPNGIIIQALYIAANTNPVSTIQTNGTLGIAYPTAQVASICQFYGALPPNGVAIASQPVSQTEVAVYIAPTVVTGPLGIMVFSIGY